MNKNYPLVSVIIPVYNVEKYLRKCVNSILEQTYKPLEIILIDDGSMDRSGAICDEYKREYPQLIVIHKANGGLSDARNTGMEMASGEYISFVDSDDFLSPYFYEIMIGCMIRDRTDMAALAHGITFWDEDGESGISMASSVKDYVSEIVSNTDAIEMMLYMKHATGVPWKIYKKQILNGFSFPKGYLYEDLATTYKLMLRAEKISIVTADIYAYRKRMESIVRQDFSKRKLIILEITDNMMADIRKSAPELIDAAAVRCFAAIFSVYLQIPRENRKLRKKVWEYIIRYRKQVLKNYSRIMRKKDRIAAIISFLGMNISYDIGKKWGQKGTMYK